MSRVVALLLLPALAAGPALAWSIWTPVGPALSPVLCGTISSSNPQVMLIAVSKGTTATLFRTTDRGVSWSIASDSLSFRPQAVSFQPGSDNILYAVDSKVFRSIDRGQTWFQLETPDATVWCNLGFSVADSNEVWLAGYSAAGARGRAAAAVSTDAGTNWTVFDCDSAVRSCSHSVALDPAHDSTIYCGGSIAGRAVVYKSTDKGSSWTRHDLPTSAMPDSVEPDRPPPQEEPVGGRVHALYVDPLNTSVLLAAMSWSGVYRSTDAGTTWSHCAGINEAHSLAYVPLQPEVVFVGATNCIYRTQDAGAHWGGSYQPPYGGQVGCVLVLGYVTNEALAATGAAVFRTIDQGQYWDPAGVLDTVRTIALEVVRTAPQFVYTAIAGAGVFRSTNGGDGWSRCRGFPGSDSVVSIAAPSADEVWALADTGLYYSTDGGASWAFEGDWFDEAGAVSVSSVLTNVVMATGSQRDSAQTSRFAIASTTDRGQNWSHFWLCEGGMGKTMAPSLYEPGRFLVAGESAAAAVVYSSGDTGRTWIRVGAGLTGVVRDMEFQPGSWVVLSRGTPDGVFRSPDAGNNWQNIGLTRVNAVAYLQSWEMCVGTDVGAFLRQGGGWDPYSVGLVDSGVVSLGVGDWYLCAGTQTAGLFRGYFPSGIRENPASVLLHTVQSGPTIVRAAIVIREAPGAGQACLMDACGRRIIALHAGANDIRNLSPGVYFIALHNGTPTRKVVLTE